MSGRRYLGIAALVACGHREPAPPPIGGSGARVARPVEPAKPAATAVLVLADVPGWAPTEIERQVTIPIERALQGIVGLSSVTSSSTFGHAAIELTFDRRAMLDARSDVNERLASAVLPSEIQATLGPPTTADGVALRYLVRGDAMTARTAQDWMIRRALLSVPGVAEVGTCGGLVEQDRVTVDPARLAAQRLRIDDVIDALAGAQRRAPTTANGTFTVHGSADVSLGALGDEPIKRGAVTIRVRDVATLAVASAPATCVAADARAQVVEGELWLRTGDDRARVTELARNALADVARTLPPGITIEIPAVEPPIEVEISAGDRELATTVHALQTAAGAATGAVVIDVGAFDVSGAWMLPDRARVHATVADRASIIARLAQLPGVHVIPRGGATAWIHLAGEDLAVLASARDTIEAAVSATPGVTVIEHTPARLAPNVEITPDRARLANFGLDVSDAEQTIAAALGGVAAGMRRDGERIIPVVVATGSIDRPTDVRALAAIGVTGANGLMVPLGQVATVHAEARPVVILRDNGRRRVGLRVRYDGPAARDALVHALAAVIVPAAVEITDAPATP